MTQRTPTRILVTALSAAAVLALGGQAAAGLDTGLEADEIPIADASGSQPVDELDSGLMSDLVLVVESEGSLMDAFLGDFELTNDYTGAGEVEVGGELPGDDTG